MILKRTIEERVEVTLQRYVLVALNEYRAKLGPGKEDEAEALWRDYLLGSLARIQRKLGSERYAEAKALLESALALPIGDQTGPKVCSAPISPSFSSLTLRLGGRGLPTPSQGDAVPPGEVLRSHVRLSD